VTGIRVDDIVRLFKKPKDVSEGVQKRWDEEHEAQLRAREVIQRRYEALGGMRFEEAMTLFLFVLLVSAWIFRAPRFVTGWASLFQK
jgi:hypothetical protein